MCLYLVLILPNQKNFSINPQFLTWAHRHVIPFFTPWRRSWDFILLIIRQCLVSKKISIIIKSSWLPLLWIQCWICWVIELHQLDSHVAFALLVYHIFSSWRPKKHLQVEPKRRKRWPLCIRALAPWRERERERHEMMTHAQ